MAAAYARLRDQLAEPPGLLAARLRAISECLSAGGHDGREPVSCRFVTGDGWALLTAGEARIACGLVDVSGVPTPVALAIQTSQEQADEEAAAATPGARQAPATPSPVPG